MSIRNSVSTTKATAMINTEMPVHSASGTFGTQRCSVPAMSATITSRNTASSNGVMIPCSR